MRHIKIKHLGVQLSHQNEYQAMNVEESVDDMISNTTNQSPLLLPIISDSFQGGQAKITSYIMRPMSLQKNKDLDNQLVKMIVKEFQPLALVEDKEFKKFINMLNSSYSLPSRKTISSALIPQCYNSTVEKIKNHLKSVKAVVITTDGWTSIKNESFIAVTAHLINEDCELKSYLLDCFQYSEKHSADNLATELKWVLSEWDVIDKISIVVSDNAANTKAAVKKCLWRHIPCFAHTVNLIVRAGIQEINAVQVKVKSVVEFFRRSPQAALKLINSQKQMGYKELKLKQDVQTRWNSTYEMFLRFMELKEPVLSTLALIKPELNQFDERNCLILKKACDLLGISQEVTVELSSEKCVSLSEVILVSKALMRHVIKISSENDLPDEIKKMINIMNQQLSLRYAEVEVNPVLAESAILDPRFKRQGFQHESLFKNVCKSLQQRVTSMNSSVHPQDNEATSSTYLEPSTSALWEDFDFKMEHLLQNRNSIAFGVIELDKYLQEPNILRKEDPLLWWRENRMPFMIFSSLNPRPNSGAKQDNDLNFITLVVLLNNIIFHYSYNNCILY